MISSSDSTKLALVLAATLLQMLSQATLSNSNLIANANLQPAATITMQQLRPLVTPFSFDGAVFENQRTSILCSVSRGDNLNIKWFKDNKLLTQELAYALKILIKSPDAYSSTLSFNPVKLEHAGDYTCEADNKYGAHAHTAALLVHSEPRWLTQPSELIVVSRNQLVVIDCQSTGWPRPNQTWSMKTHAQSEFQAITNDGKHSLAANGSLIIKNVSKSDEANYLCKASNGIGRGISTSSAVKVNVPAYFESNKAQTHLVRRQTQIQLRCDAHGDEPLAIEWLKDSQRLAGDYDSRYTIHTTRQSAAPVSSGSLISVLIIRQAQRNDNALFECVTKNQAGRDKLQIELIVQEEPDNIQMLQASQITPRSVTIVWPEPYDGKSPITSYIIQYKRVDEPSLSANHPSSASQSQPSLISSNNIQQQQQQIALLNEQQQQVMDQLDIEQQQQALIVKPLATIADDWQLATRLQLPVQLLANATATPTSSSGNAQLQQAQNKPMRSFSIERLEPSSKYVLRALAVNSIGQSKQFSQPFEFITDEDAPEVAPQRIKATAINSTSILVSWDELLLTKGRQVQGYYVGYRQQNNNNNFILKPIINEQFGNNNNLLMLDQQQQTQLSRMETIISDLKRNTPYEITVNAFNSQGSGPSGELVVAKTIEMEAPKPVKLMITRESNESIYLEWHRDLSDQNPVEDYVLFQEKNSPSKELNQVRLPANQTQYKAPGLKCGTRYQFYVIAVNRVGKSRPSELVSASTSGAAPLIPSKQSLIKMINSTCLEVNLNAFQDNGCRLKTFTLRYRTERILANAHANMSNGHHNNPSSSPKSLADLDPSSKLGGSQVNHGSGSLGSLVGSATINGAGGASIASSGASSTPGDWVTVIPRANSMKHHHQHHYSSVPFQRLSNPSASSASPSDNGEDKVELLCNLNPTGEYTIHVAAGNDVGRSEIEYTVLMSSDELKYSFLRELGDCFAQLPNLLAYIPSIIVFLLAGLFVCLCALILYTTAIRCYQKLIIMQNQNRASKRAKADERRRRKLQQQQASKQAPGGDLWAEEYQEEEEDGNGNGQLSNGHTNSMDDDSIMRSDSCNADDDADDDDDDDNDVNGLVGGRNGGGYYRPAQYTNKPTSNIISMLQPADLLDDEDANLTSASGGTISTQSIGSSSIGGRKMLRTRRSHGAAAGAGVRRSNSTALHHAQHQHLCQSQHQNQMQNQQQQRLLPNLHFANRSQQLIPSHYMANNLHASNSSGFDDSSSMDTSSIRMNTQQQQQFQVPTKYGIPPPQLNGAGKSPATGKANQQCAMSTVSNDSSIHGPFQCLNSKQYVKMNEYTMMPTLGQTVASDIYGTTTGAPSGLPNNASAALATNNSNVQRSNSLYYSTLRRTSMQTYLPQQRQQQQQAQSIAMQSQPTNLTLNRKSPQRQKQVAMHHYQQQQQQANDIYGYHYVSPKMAVPAANSSQGSATQSPSGASQASSLNKQQQDEVANSIFVPARQIIYSAPNIRQVHHHQQHHHHHHQQQQHHQHQQQQQPSAFL